MLPKSGLAFPTKSPVIQQGTHSEAMTAPLLVDRHLVAIPGGASNIGTLQKSHGIRVGPSCMEAPHTGAHKRKHSVHNDPEICRAIGSYLPASPLFPGLKPGLICCYRFWFFSGAFCSKDYNSMPERGCCRILFPYTLMGVPETSESPALYTPKMIECQKGTPDLRNRTILKHCLPWILPPLSNSWIMKIIRLCIALNRTPDIDCYWVGAIPNAYQRSASRGRGSTSAIAIRKTHPDFISASACWVGPWDIIFPKWLQ